MTPTALELEYFTDVFRTRHLSRAALRLGITQPALTQCIKKLEAKTDTKLFHRAPHGMIPTKQAEVLYRHATRLRESWTSIQSELRSTREGLAGRFRIGCHPSVASYCLPSVIRELDRSAPRIELELIHDSSRKTLEKIVSFEVDFGFVVNPVRHPDLVLKAIGEDLVRFWVKPVPAARSPIAMKSARATVPSRLITDLNLTRTTSLLGSSSVFKGWSVFQSESLEVVRTLTLQGAGVGCLPQRVALADGPVLAPYRPRELPEFHDRIFLAYRKDVILGEASKALLRACSRSIGELPKPA